MRAQRLHWWIVALAGVGTLGMAAGVARELRADEEYTTWPIPCPQRMFWNLEVDGIWFRGLSITKRDRLSTGSIATYDVDGEPVSDDGRWYLVGGGIVLQCMKYGIRGIVEFDIYKKLDEWGRLVPMPEPGECEGEEDDGEMDEVRSPFATKPSAVPRELPEFASCGPGGGSGGSYGGCHAEYGVIEISFDDGLTWHTLWEGWYTVCDE